MSTIKNCVQSLGHFINQGSFVIRKQWLDQAETLTEKKKPSWAGSKMYFPGKWNCKYWVIINVEDSYKIIFVYDVCAVKCNEEG